MIFNQYILRANTQKLWFKMLSQITKDKPKVFGIGLSRTGTKSLHRALKILGYKSGHFSTQLIRYEYSKIVMDFDSVKYYESLTDITASKFYRELDEEFPDSKFILTVRDLDAWLKSCERHFPKLAEGELPYNSEKIMQLRMDIYDCISFDKEKFTKAYESHLDQVKNHFSNRPSDLLILNICGNNNWKNLCDFLGVPIPKKDFPWANRYMSRKK
jgi:hypothetical protein